MYTIKGNLSDTCILQKFCYYLKCTNKNYKYGVTGEVGIRSTKGLPGKPDQLERQVSYPRTLENNFLKKLPHMPVHAQKRKPRVK